MKRVNGWGSYLEVKALMVERQELARPQRIARVLRDAAEQLRLMEQREEALIERQEQLERELAAALAAKSVPVAPEEEAGRFP